MKTKNKVIKIILPTLFVVGLVVAGGCIIWKINAINHTKIEPTSPTTPNGPDTPNQPVKPKKFLKDDLTINFNLSERTQMIDYTLESVSFRQEAFEYFFIVEFHKLGPTTNDINLNFKFSKEDLQKVIVKFIYNQETTTPFIWNFEIKKI